MSVYAVNYFYTGQYLPTESWQVYYNFASIAGGYLSSISGANSACSGKVIGTLTVKSNSGYFAGNSYLEIQNSTGDLTDWTILCSFQKESRTEGVLFSNFCSGQTIHSGFIFGVTANNRLYLESYTENTPLVFQAPIILGRKNIVAVSKVGQSLYFDYFNANSKRLESIKYETPDKSFLNSSKWTVGGAPNAPSYFSGNYFSGIIDNFIILNEAIRPDEIKQLIKGFYCSGSSGIPIEDKPYIYSLGMNRLSFLKRLDFIDREEIYLAVNKDNKITFNQDAIFDNVIGEFYSSTYIQNTGVAAYVNGLAQIVDSGVSVGGTFYSPTYTLTGNVVPSGYQLFANKVNNGDDRFVYDIPNHSISKTSFIPTFSHDGSADVLISGSNSATDLVFYNGMKLVLGIDYSTQTLSTIKFSSGNSLYDGETGVLLVVPSDTDVSYIGTSNILNSGVSRYARGTSQIWLNGVRQNLDETYLEIADIDLLSNTGIFPIVDGVLFGNDLFEFILGNPLSADNFFFTTDNTYITADITIY